MEQVKFGLFDWIDRGNAPLQKLYGERLQLPKAESSAGEVRDLESLEMVLEQTPHVTSGRGWG